MAVAMPVRRPKQSARLAATLYSPPETWMSSVRALRKGIDARIEPMDQGPQGQEVQFTRFLLDRQRAHGRSVYHGPGKENCGPSRGSWEVRS